MTVHAVIVALSWEREGGVEVPTVAHETQYSPFDQPLWELELLGSVRGLLGAHLRWRAEAEQRAVERESKRALLCALLGRERAAVCACSRNARARARAGCAAVVAPGPAGWTAHAGRWIGGGPRGTKQLSTRGQLLCLCPSSYTIRSPS